MFQTSAVSLPFSVRLGGPHPTRFGCARRRWIQPAKQKDARWSEDLRWFASAYAAGFVAVSTLIA